MRRGAADLGLGVCLEKIERDNVFVVPLHMSRRWYRYHHLFGELLRAELQRSEPDLVAGLHRRADHDDVGVDVGGGHAIHRNDTVP